ncbi:sigma-70 family RNA polymerase sigma factor [Chitinophaga sp. NPDC101104]|uniref:sigma-70 family RNA polymerase sigma factor n=1 Tax=Chitinophaga sp. NPDC101104 TaxID=3390561 RepID=UPI003D091286
MQTILPILAQLEGKLEKRICSRVNHADCCEDILQDVYLKLLQRLPQISQAENVIPYVMKMADNAVADYFRKKGKALTGAAEAEHLPAPASEPENLVARLSDSFVGQMIQALPPIYREALVKSEIEGISQKQLAAELGMSYSGLKSRVQRSKEMLRAAILECCDFEFDKYGNIVSCCGGDCT